MPKQTPGLTQNIIRKTELGQHAHDPWIRVMRSVIGVTIVLTILTVLVLVFPGQQQNESDTNGNEVTGMGALERLSGSQISDEARQMIGISGTIARIQGNSLIMQGENGEEITLTIEENTAIVRTIYYTDAAPATEESITISSLSVGDKIQVLAKNTAGQVNKGTAQKIVLSQ
ncbi:MAG: hypothetical protein H6760_00850 [Candidatus Nomurabacteria bacterium]|nr:MAG: hypothetical protein H6760_00850 [Candidatus Nomurabacteria bacterium]